MTRNTKAVTTAFDVDVEAVTSNVVVSNIQPYLELRTKRRFPPAYSCDGKYAVKLTVVLGVCEYIALQYPAVLGGTQAGSGPRDYSYSTYGHIHMHNNFHHKQCRHYCN